MRPVSYARVTGVEAAVTLVGGDPGSAFLAGGTTKIDLLRLGVEHSDRLVDINALPLADVEELPDGTIRIGALARMSDVARTPIVKERFELIVIGIVILSVMPMVVEYFKARGEAKNAAKEDAKAASAS